MASHFSIEFAGYHDIGSVEELQPPSLVALYARTEQFQARLRQRAKELGITCLPEKAQHPAKITTVTCGQWKSGANAVYVGDHLVKNVNGTLSWQTLALALGCKLDGYLMRFPLPEAPDKLSDLTGQMKEAQINSLKLEKERAERRARRLEEEILAIRDGTEANPELTAQEFGE